MEKNINTMPSFSELKKEAKEKLRGKYTIPIISYLVYFVSVMIISTILQKEFSVTSAQTLNYLMSLFVYAIIILGFWHLYMKIYREEKIEYGDVFYGFKNYPKYVVLVLLHFIYTFLWSLLLIIPGIIKGLSYAQCYFIALDNPDLSPNECITESRKMMDGYKWKYFLLNLSFIGWILLGVLTFGILYIWLLPYMSETAVGFYEHLKKPETTETAAV